MLLDNLQTRQWKKLWPSTFQWRMQIVKYFSIFYYLIIIWISVCHAGAKGQYQYLFSIVSKTSADIQNEMWWSLPFTLILRCSPAEGGLLCSTALSLSKWGVLRSRFQLKQIITRGREIGTKQMHLTPEDKGSREVEVPLCRESSAWTLREGLGIVPRDLPVPSFYNPPTTPSSCFLKMVMVITIKCQGRILHRQGWGQKKAPLLKGHCDEIHNSLHYIILHSLQVKWFWCIFLA